jgi:hypothetical protein
VINGRVSLEVVVAMIGAELAFGVLEGSDDVVTASGEDQGRNGRTRHRRARRRVHGRGAVTEGPVVVHLLRSSVERNGPIAKHKLTMYPTREQKIAALEA